MQSRKEGKTWAFTSEIDTHTQIDIEALRRAYKETQSLRKAAKAVGVSYRTAQKTLYAESRWTIKYPKK